MPGLMVLNVKILLFQSPYLSLFTCLKCPECEDNAVILYHQHPAVFAVVPRLLHHPCSLLDDFSFWLNVYTFSQFVFFKLASLPYLQCLCLLLTITIPWVQLCHHHLLSCWPVSSSNTSQCISGFPGNSSPFVCHPLQCFSPLRTSLPSIPALKSLSAPHHLCIHPPHLSACLATWQCWLP